MKIRIGLIGFGGWTKTAYIPAINEDGRTVIVAVTAATEKTRKNVKDVLGPHVLVYSSYDEMLENTDIDAVMIAVPDELHQATISAALNKNIPVFYEPPIADTRKQIKHMINELLYTNQIAIADLELGLNPVISHAAKIINEQIIGSIQNVTISLEAAWGPEKQNLDLSLINRSATWYIDIINRLLKSNPKRVLVLDGYGNTGRRQTISTGIFDYDGIWGFLKINVNSAEKLLIEIEINGNEGDITIDLLKGQFRMRTLNNPEWTTIIIPAKRPNASWPGVRESVSSFIDTIIHGTDCHGSPKTVAQLHLIGLAAEESIDTKTWAIVQHI